MAFYNASFFVKDFVDVDVTRMSFEFSDLESSVRENIEADSFWCMTKVSVLSSLINQAFKGPVNILLILRLCATIFFCKNCSVTRS